MKSKELIALVAILLASFAIRVINLENNPPGFFVDEAAAAFDARSIIETGRDMWGEKFPLFFKSLGDYNSGYHRYLIIPFVAVFGSHIWSARLPIALASFLTVVICFFIGKRLGGFRLGLFCAMFFGFSPWSIMYARVAMEQALVPFFLSLIIWAILAWRGAKPTLGNDLALGALFGVTFYSYQACRLFIPLFFAGFLVLEAKRLGLKRIVLLAVGFVLVLVPALEFAIRQPEQFFARFRQILSSEQAQPYLSQGSLISSIYGYFVHFSPNFLFFKGDANIRHSPEGFGMMYPIELFLIPLGLFYVFKIDRKSFWTFLLIVILFPIPASVSSRDVPHGLRTITALPTVELLSALGLEFLFTKRDRLKSATVALIIGELVCVALFAHHLFFKYPDYAKLRWRWDHKQLFIALDPYKETHQIVLYTYEAFAWVLAAHYWHASPKEFQKYQRVFDLIMPSLHPDFSKYFVAPTGVFVKSIKDKPTILAFSGGGRFDRYRPNFEPWKIISLPDGEPLFFLYLLSDSPSH